METKKLCFGIDASYTTLDASYTTLDVYYQNNLGELFHRHVGTTIKDLKKS